MTDEIIQVRVNPAGPLAGDIDGVAHELLEKQGARATQELKASRASGVDVTRELVEVPEFMERVEELVKDRNPDDQLDGYEVERVTSVSLEVEDHGYIGVRVTEEEGQ